MCDSNSESQSFSQGIWKSNLSLKLTSPKKKKGNTFQSFCKTESILISEPHEVVTREKIQVNLSHEHRYKSTK